MTQSAQHPHGPISESSALALRGEYSLSTHVQDPRLPPPEDDAIDLRRYWEIILKRKWTVISFFFIVVIAVAVGTLLMTPIYRSSLTLQIERTEAKVVEIQQVTPNEALSDSRDFYQTQYELLKSRTLAQRVIDQLNLAQNPAFTQKNNTLLDYIGMGGEEQTKDAQRTKAGQESPVVTRFLKLLTIEPVRNSRLVKVRFEHADPQLATRIVNAVAQSYIALNLERRIDASSYAKTFLQERLEQVKAKLEDSERSVNQFARDQEIIKTDEKQSSVDSQTLQEFTGALAKVQQERIQAEAVYAQMQVVKHQGIPEVMQNPTIQRLKETKAKLEADYQDGLMIYKPGYPKLLQLEAQIAEVQAKINEEVENVRATITSVYESAKNKESMISAKLQQAKSSMLGLQDRSVQYNVLKREADTNRQLYEGLLHRYKEVGVAGGIGINNIAIVDKADIPGHPFKPKLPINLMIAAFLGLFGGIALAFLFEHLDDTVKDGEDLERELRLPLLGLIPFRKNATDADNELALELVNDSRSAFAESFRSLRTSLQFSTPTGVPKILMVTSTSMGEGKTTTALSMAISFAQAGKSVLLIDADLRKASLHKKLGMSNERGLTNLLAGEALAPEVTAGTTIPQLYVMLSGPLPPNPAELLASAKMASLLALASEKFDQVIIDGPPVLGLADAPLLGSLVQATVLVIEYSATRRGYAKDAMKRLRATRTHILGGIITKVDAFGQGYGYYQNYYYSYEGSQEAKASQVAA